MNNPRKRSKLLTLREKYKDSGMQEQCIQEVNTGTLSWLRKPLFFPYRKCVTCALFRNFLHIISGPPLRQNFVKKMHIPSLIQRLTLLVCFFNAYIQRGRKVPFHCMIFLNFAFSLKTYAKFATQNSADLSSKSKPKREREKKKTILPKLLIDF